MTKLNALALGLSLTLGGATQAQLTTTETTTVTTTAPTGGVRLRSQILGSNVHLRGNMYGKVEDMVINEAGGVDYLVVSNDGRYVMLPYDAGTMNYEQRIVTYNVEPQALQPLMFERTAWPRTIEPAYVGQIGRIFPNRGRVRRDVITPGGAVIQEDVKVKRDGRIIIKDKIKD